MHLREPLLLKTPGADGFDNVTQQEALPCRIAIYAYVEPLRMGADGKLQPGKLRWMLQMTQAVLHQCGKQLGTCGATLTGRHQGQSQPQIKARFGTVKPTILLKPHPGARMIENQLRSRSIARRCGPRRG